MTEPLRLYDYWRSSAAYRARIGLNLKGVTYDAIPVNIKPGNDEQLQDSYTSLAPNARVPAMRVGDVVLQQSLAILEWLEEAFPDPAILPTDPLDRAQVRAFAHVIAMDIHPLTNVAPLSYLRQHHGAGDTEVQQWISHWVLRGLQALEDEQVRRPQARYCFGDTPGLADICLVPQIYSARRYGIDLKPFAKLVSIADTCLEHPAFIAASPEQQKDAVAP